MLLFNLRQGLLRDF